MHKGLGRPERAAFIGFAATLPEAQGSGLGLALTDASFNWAAEHGYEVMVTDWRVTNLLSSRFWPKRGFRPVFLRLYRSIPLGDAAATALRDAVAVVDAPDDAIVIRPPPPGSRSPTCARRCATRCAFRSRASRSRRSSRAAAGRRSSSSLRRCRFPVPCTIRGRSRSPPPRPSSSASGVPTERQTLLVAPGSRAGRTAASSSASASSRRGSRGASAARSRSTTPRIRSSSTSSVAGQHPAPGEPRAASRPISC